MKPTKKPTYEELEKELAGLRSQSKLKQNGDEKILEKSEEAERHLGNIMNSIGDPIFVKDDQSRLILVNDAFCELFQLSREEIIGKSLDQEVAPDERKSFLKIDKTVLDKGIENINEESITIRDGQSLRISTRKTRFLDGNGNKYLVGIIHDITERSKSQQDLLVAKEHAEEYKERFRILMLNMEAGVVIHAPDTSIVQNNKRASEILGLSDEQLKGKTAIDPDWKFMNTDEIPLPHSDYPVNRIASSGRPIQNQIIGSYQPDKKQIVWATVNGFPVLDNEGNIKEIVTIFVDITAQRSYDKERLANQRKLEKTERELTKAQKLAHIGSWTFNPGTTKPEWSDEMFRIWGFDPTEGPPSYDPEIISRVHPDDLQLFNSAFSKAISPGIPYDIEFRVCIPGAEEKNVRSIFEPAKGENGEVIISGTNQDITEQKKFEKDQVKHQRLKAIGEMSSSIAHDFNNALQEMMGNLEVIRLENILTVDTQNRLNVIGSIITDTAGRVSALQNFGNPVSNHHNNVHINLNLLIEESLNQSRPLWKDEMEKEGRRIKIKTAFEEIPKISCPRGELKTVVFNLIKNGIEAMPDGGQIIIRTGTREELVFASFTDTGVGMDAEAKMKLFEPFFTTKGFNPGRGLGMSGAYSIIKKCKGDIRVEHSEVNKGTTIEISFPISDQPEVKVAKENVSQPKNPYQVLWVDDDFIITKSSSRMLESLGHTCATVNSGKKALEYLEQYPCDILFTDIGMPKMNGWELADAIREKFGNQIKIIAVTGWNMEEKVAEEDAIDLFLQKPFALPDLKTTLAEISGYFKPDKA